MGARLPRRPVMPEPDPYALPRFNVAKVIVLTGFSLTMLVCLVLVTTSAWLFITTGDVPDALREWAGLALGYLFGTFTALVSDFTDRNTA